MSMTEKITYRGRENKAYCDHSVREIINRLADYEDIGTVSEFRELKEKAMAKPREIIQGEYLCPICGCKVNYQGYCHYCGQRVY